MSRQPIIRDPILGDLRWNQSAREWQSQLDFTPKHQITVSLFASSTLARDAQRELILEPARTAFVYHRKREWEYRLQVAQILVDCDLVAELDPALVAQRLRLGEVELFQDGRGGWRYHITLAEDRDFAILVALSQTDLVDVHF